MADNRNMELNDEQLANAAGGEGIVYDDPQYQIGDRVVEREFPDTVGTIISRRTQFFQGSETWHWMYKVKWDNGVTTEKDEKFLDIVLI